MSFGLPPVKPKDELPVNNEKFTNSFDVPDVMTYGLTASKIADHPPHPVFASEINYQKNRNSLNMAMLRNTQGLHAPLKIQMELKAAKKVGRLPFLQSSNVMYDALTGRDLEIGPEDVFNAPEFKEYGGQPHAVVERTINVL